MRARQKIVLTFSIFACSAVCLGATVAPQSREEALKTLKAMFAARSAEVEVAEKEWYKQPNRTRESNRQDALPRKPEELQWLLKLGREALEQQPVDWPVLELVARNLWWDALSPEIVDLARSIVRLELPSNPVNDRGASPANTVRWALCALAKSSTREDLKILLNCATAPVTGANRKYVRGADAFNEEWVRSWLFTTACDNVLAMTEQKRVLPFMKRVAKAFPKDAPQARVIKSCLGNAKLIAAGKPVPVAVP